MPLSTRIKKFYRLTTQTETSQKVAFCVVGAQKSGTTALDKYLRHHTQLAMPDKKEVHFFDHSKLFRKNPINYRTYQAYFPSDCSGKLMGDVTPGYMFIEPCMQRIKDYNPEMKLIAILRNPITRAYSHWNMECDHGREKKPFSEAIALESSRLAKGDSSSKRKYSYVSRGYYSSQIERMWQHFPKDQTHFIKYDELRNNPTQAVNSIYRFLGVDELPETKKQAANYRPYKTSMTESEFEQLKEVFSGEIHKLESMLDWDLSDWLKFST